MQVRLQVLLLRVWGPFAKPSQGRRPSFGPIGPQCGSPSGRCRTPRLCTSRPAEIHPLAQRHLAVDACRRGMGLGLPGFRLVTMFHTASAPVPSKPSTNRLRGGSIVHAELPISSTSVPKCAPNLSGKSNMESNLTYLGPRLEKEMSMR